MNSTLLRVDWYSFLIGTQISSTIGILTTSVNLRRQGIRIRFSREYLYPSFSNNGNLLFLFRIKEPGNWFKNGLRLLCTIFEKNICAGVIYVTMEEYLSSYLQENVVRAFACGGMLGLYACMSYNCYDFRDISIWQALLCFLASSEISVLFEEVKILVPLEGSDINFNLTVPFDSSIFWGGAIVGSLVGLKNAYFLETLDDIPIPDIDDTDTNMVITAKYLRFAGNILNCAVKCVLGLHERFLVGGVMHCLFEYLTQNVTGMKSSFRTSLLSASLLGIFLGMESGHMKPALKISWIVTTALRLAPLITGHFRKFMMSIAKV